MDCSRCRLPENAHLREEWGCDEEKPDGVRHQSVLLFEACDACAGRGCAACGKSGRVPMKRCPNALLEPGAVDFVEDAQLLELGVLPTAGGVCDQAAQWWLAVRIVLAERARVEKAK